MQHMSTTLMLVSRWVCTGPDFAGLDVPTADQQAAESMTLVLPAGAIVHQQPYRKSSAEMAQSLASIV